MRPIRLKLTAFGAYVKPLELDFEKGLGGSNFFLIHGATGSGKTTILDAICYALYGESSGGGRTGKMMRSEQATPDDKTAVEFTFALRGKTYHIKRNPQYLRPKQRGEGLTEEKASAEIFENGTPVETKDVSEYVRELLQFDSEQFRQVVVLPQGAFQKFLLAKSADRQTLLNMLFNADFFKRVEDALKAQAFDAKKFLDGLTERKDNLLDDAAEISGSEDFNEMQLPALTEKFQADLNAAQAQIKTLEAQSLAAQKNFTDGENLFRLFKDLEAKTQELDAAQKSLEKISGELSAAKIEFDKRTAEEPFREELKLKAADLGKKKITLGKYQSTRRELKVALAAAKDAEAEVKRLKDLRQRCDDTMARYKADVERLQDAPAKLEVAKQKLKAAQDREKLLNEIKNLREQITAAEKNSISAAKVHETAEKKLADMRTAQTKSSAARLATALEEGKPCPVCGATHHPKPATADASIPTDAQIKAAESNLKTLADRKNFAAEKLAGLKSTLAAREADLAKAAQVVTVAEAQAECDKLSADVKLLEDRSKRIKNGEVKIADTDKALDNATALEKKLSGDEKSLRGALDTMAKELDECYRDNENLLDKELSATNKQLDELNATFNRAQDNFNRLNNQAAAQRATVTAAQKNQAEAAAQVEGKTLPDMVTLKKIFDDTRATERKAVEAKANLTTRLERLTDIAKKVFAINNDMFAADKNARMWQTLSDAASGKISKISFQRYYLSTMFKEVINEANNRLEKMSGGRYRFQNREGVLDGRVRVAGLDLEIVDDYTGTARPVETLSGGESFLASLSLALGLAAVVQNNSGGVKLDTIFIDEGFGTLDTETLDFAMKTLLELQSGGRLVGIISHVEELKNQVPVRLEVFKTKTGSYAKFER